MAIPADVREVVSSGGLGKSDHIDTWIRTIVFAGIYGISLTAALVSYSPILWLLFWCVGSVILAGAYAAVHEAIHGSLFRSSIANDVAGILWGLPVLNPYATYRSFHFQHHVYTRTAKDPEPPFEATSRRRVVMVAGLAMVGLNVILWTDLVKLLLGRPASYAKRTARPKLAVINLVSFAAFFGILWLLCGSLGLVMAVWGAPAVGGSVLSGIAVTHEHLGCVSNTDDVFLHSRTIRSNRLTRFVLWNANYHTAHHLVPTVTGKNLPELQQHINDRCVISEDSFLSFYASVLRDPKGLMQRLEDLAEGSATTATTMQGSAYDERAGRRIKEPR